MFGTTKVPEVRLDLLVGSLVTLTTLSEVEKRAKWRWDGDINTQRLMSPSYCSSKFNVTAS